MKVSFSGDICVANSIGRQFTMPNLFDNCDYNFACLEGPICNTPPPFPFPKVGPNLYQHEDIKHLIGCFSHVTLANNHIMDYGWEGVNQTIEYLNQHNVQHAGCAEHYPDMYNPIVLQKDDVKVAVFCLAEAQYGCCKSDTMGQNRGYAWMLNPLVYNRIQEYAKIVNHVIMYLHAGLEGEDYPLIEWRQIYRSFIDYGADMVIASHPHVIQGKECYKGKNIYYSLGNLFFNNEDLFTLKNYRNSIILECNISQNEIKTIEHFVEFDDGSIHHADKSSENRFEALSNVLLPENKDTYLKLYNEMVLSCWERYYKSYFSFPIFKNPLTQNRIIRKIYHIRRDLLKSGVEEPVSLNHMYHNLNIDTHRFVVCRACSLLSNTY